MQEAEFDAFYDQAYPRLVRQLAALIGDVVEAQDCVQEAFVRAWSNRGKLDASEHPEAWVRTTAYRLAVSRWRRTVRSRRTPDRALQQVGYARGPSEDHVALVAALQQLPAAQRRVLVLHHLADLPVREVAREVGVAEGTVKAHLSRGRAALAALLAQPVNTGGTDV
ncbi:SigE family RNA polymerase sigma factor [Nocardioides limicola]|uniref:SigE family RNA polymerase sigma factor n=1 Tax=Nocardioides limicola TaxID=2803368 RepID=UPI00193B9D78|nr:SigE family RNA polymerase sigma factor [Nocardioides sp. DJM-14]